MEEDKGRLEQEERQLRRELLLQQFGQRYDITGLKRKMPDEQPANLDSDEKKEPAVMTLTIDREEYAMLMLMFDTRMQYIHERLNKCKTFADKDSDKFWQEEKQQLEGFRKRVRGELLPSLSSGERGKKDLEPKGHERVFSEKGYSR